MNILILSETFPPLIRASARIMKDLADSFVKNNNSVTIITFIENHSKYKHITTGEFFEDDSKVIRIKIPKQRGVGYIRRGITEKLIPYIASYKSMKFLKNETFDLIIVHSPPISLYPLVKKIKKINNCPVYLVLRDIHPQTGIDLNIYKKNSIVYKHFRSLEKKLYRICDVIATQSPANREFLLNKNSYLSSNKVKVLYNFKKADPNPANSINFKEKLGLNGKTICLYGGNMTSSQDLKELLFIAEKCSDVSNLVFLLIGYGKEKEMLLQKAEEMRLTNLVFEEPLPLDMFTSLVYQCDIGLIFLNKNFTTHNFPGKTLDYMNASLPIVASVNKANDLKDMIENKAKCGFIHYGKNMDKMVESIKYLAKNHEKAISIGNNGRVYLEKELNAQNAHKIIIKHMKEILGDKNA